MKTTIVAIGMLLLGCVASTNAFAANCCVDGVCNVYATTLNTGTAPFASGLCGHVISGSGATCKIIMQQDEAVSSGDCVELADRVTLDMNGHTLECTGTCGTAIDNTDTSTSNPVKIEGGGFIIGCWSDGATAVADTYNATITDVHIDLLNYTCFGTSGLGPYKTITRVSVGGASTGVTAGSTTSIVDSFIHNSHVGVLVRGSGGAGTDISDTLIYNSDINVQTATIPNGSGGPQTMTGSTVLTGTCQFKDYYGNCSTTAGSVIDLNGVNFLNFEIVQ
jgi:hypothetical protein